jgi:hypothetical protein
VIYQRNRHTGRLDGHCCKRDRDIVELAFRREAADIGIPDLTPIVTPSLAKKVMSLWLAGTNLDNVDEGFNPFSVIVADHTTTSGEAAYEKAMQAAMDYDDLMLGAGVPLTDLKAVKSTTALIPESASLTRAMLKAFQIILTSLLGDQHPLAHCYGDFLTNLDCKEHFYFERLHRADTKHGPARLLRFFQLHTRACFRMCGTPQITSPPTASPCPLSNKL